MAAPLVVTLQLDELKSIIMVHGEEGGKSSKPFLIAAKNSTVSDAKAAPYLLVCAQILFCGMCGAVCGKGLTTVSCP